LEQIVPVVAGCHVGLPDKLQQASISRRLEGSVLAQIVPTSCPSLPRPRAYILLEERTMRTWLVVGLLSFFGSAHAALVTIDPGNFLPGTDISKRHAWSHVVQLEFFSSIRPFV
jgi:hypothetical protein